MKIPTMAVEYHHILNDTEYIQMGSDSITTRNIKRS